MPDGTICTSMPATGFGSLLQSALLTLAVSVTGASAFET